MLLSFRHAPGFDETHHALDLAGWSPTANRLRVLANDVKAAGHLGRTARGNYRTSPI